MIRVTDYGTHAEVQVQFPRLVEYIRPYSGKTLGDLINRLRDEYPNQIIQIEAKHETDI